MSIHKLSAGSGYDDLTRQVAALDASEKGHVGLATYYTERRETPGAWIGSGLAGIDGLNAGDAVTAEQMRALFGAGMHPLATKRLRQLTAADLTDTNIKTATRLGAPFKVYAGEVSPFRIEVAKRIATRQTAAGQLADESVSAALRAQVRTEVAREFFRNPAWPHDDHPAAALWWRILDQLPETPNQEPATPEAVPATRCTTTRPFDRQPPVPRLAPPPRSAGAADPAARCRQRREVSAESAAETPIDTYQGPPVAAR